MVMFLALVVAGPASSARERVSLDQGWRFKLDDIAGFSNMPKGAVLHRWLWIEGEAGEESLVTSTAAPAGREWREAAAGEDVFKGRLGFVWYRTTLPGVKGLPRFVYFEGVDDNAVIYLNGCKIFEHEGWSEAFEVPLGAAWKPDGPNELAVRVENTDGPGSISRAAVYAGRRLIETAAWAAPKYDDAAWRAVSVPHDFVVEGGFDPGADKSHGYRPKGVGWYRRSFDLPASAKGRRVWLEFDGVYRDSTVWLNGTVLGTHQSGYTSFMYDATDAAVFDGQNSLVVRADARQNEGWWYEGGGIYRHVWLTTLDPLHVDHWGLFVTTPKVTDASARVRVRTTVRNEGSRRTSATVWTEIVDADGKVVATARGARVIPAGGSHEYDQAVTLNSPRRWSVEDPYLYTVRATVHRDDEVVDADRAPLGVRTIRFDAEKGFFLNEKSVKIKGTCNHQDFAGVGVALPDRLHEYKIEKLKAMGSNGYRCAHHPPAAEILDACDRLGMLVMDENRHLGDSDEIKAQVTSMVKRDRNHPSIVIWSTCNEERHQGTDLAKRQGKALYDLIYKLDGTRPVTSAMNQRSMWGKGLSLVQDVQGTNYNPEGYDEYHAKFPKQPMISTESASTLTTRGIYEKDEKRTFMSSYTDGAEYHLRPVMEKPFMAGTFVWTGFDYRGEPTPYDWPCINSHFGIMDTCGFPKDDYWYYLSWWGDKPVVHLMPHWNNPPKDKDGIVQVKCYSNCERVELLLNGRSMGTQDMPRYGHLNWSVKYEPGTLEARGYNGGIVAAQTKVETTGKPAAIVLTPDRTTLKANGQDVAVVECSIVDAEGRVVPTADNEVVFSLSGPGRILGVGNGNPSSLEPDVPAKRKAFGGRCVTTVIAPSLRSAASVVATSPGLRSGVEGLDFHEP